MKSEYTLVDKLYTIAIFWVAQLLNRVGKIKFNLENLYCLNIQFWLNLNVGNSGAGYLTAIETGGDLDEDEEDMDSTNMPKLGMKQVCYNMLSIRPVDLY